MTTGSTRSSSAFPRAGPCSAAHRRKSIRPISRVIFFCETPGNEYHDLTSCSGHHRCGYICMELLFCSTLTQPFCDKFFMMCNEGTGASLGWIEEEIQNGTGWHSSLHMEYSIVGFPPCWKMNFIHLLEGIK